MGTHACILILCDGSGHTALSSNPQTCCYLAYDLLENKQNGRNRIDDVNGTVEQQHLGRFLKGLQYEIKGHPQQQVW